MLKSKDTEAKGPAIYFFPTGEMFRLVKTRPLLPFLSFPPSLLPCVREHDNLLFVIYLAACRYTSRNRREIVTLTDSLLSFVAPTKKKKKASNFEERRISRISHYVISHLVSSKLHT